MGAKKKIMIRRTLEKKVREAASLFPVIGIMGPRQSGKTTLAKLVFPHHAYVNLEDFSLRMRVQEDPRGFFDVYANEHGIILDEVQNVPTILSYIQTDSRSRAKKGIFYSDRISASFIK